LRDSIGTTFAGGCGGSIAGVDRSSRDLVVSSAAGVRVTVSGGDGEKSICRNVRNVGVPSKIPIAFDRPLLGGVAEESAAARSMS
jgi:hypothetical protein